MSGDRHWRCLNPYWTLEALARLCPRYRLASYSLLLLFWTMPLPAPPLPLFSIKVFVIPRTTDGLPAGNIVLKHPLRSDLLNNFEHNSRTIPTSSRKHTSTSFIRPAPRRLITPFEIKAIQACLSRNFAQLFYSHLYSQLML